MNTKIENALDDFYSEENQTLDQNNLNPNTVNNKKVILNQREGLIERVDKIFVTSDGRQLLREQY